MRLGAALLALICLAAGTGEISLAVELCLFPCKQLVQQADTSLALLHV